MCVCVRLCIVEMSVYVVEIYIWHDVASIMAKCNVRVFVKCNFIEPVISVWLCMHEKFPKNLFLKEQIIIHHRSWKRERKHTRTHTVFCDVMKCRERAVNHVDANANLCQMLGITHKCFLHNILPVCSYTLDSVAVFFSFHMLSLSIIISFLPIRCSHSFSRLLLRSVSLCVCRFQAKLFNLLRR